MLRIAKIIIRYRTFLLISLGILTIFMAIKSTDVKLQWGLPKLLPDSDSVAIEFNEFNKKFGEESIFFLLAIDKDPFETLELFNYWYDLASELQKIKGVKQVLSINKLPILKKDTKLKTFYVDTIPKRRLKNDEELKKIKKQILSIPFYDGLIYNSKSKVPIIALELDKNYFNSLKRKNLVDSIVNKIKIFETKTNVYVYKSGLPYIRIFTTRLIKSELSLFIVLAFIATICILFFFFRSFYPVLVSIIIVAIGVIWSLGTLSILNYEVTILTSIIPPLIIVIGIPNAVYLINKYHLEYTSHKNKILSLIRVVTKIGKLTFLTNLTTAIGFSAFIFTDSQILIEFGIVSSINIILIFIVSLIIIPAVFSFLPAPTTKHTKHLNKNWVVKTVKYLEYLVINKKQWIYIITVIIVVLGILGITKIKSTGNLTDDLPRQNLLIQDLKFFEKHFKGVMPLDIVIDTKKKGGAIRSFNMRKVEKLEKELGALECFSKPISLVDGMKFVRQSFYGGDKKMYKLIENQEKIFFEPYFNNFSNKEILNQYVDSTKQFIKIYVQMADVGIIQSDSILSEVKLIVEKIFSTKKYNIVYTGLQITYLKGTLYLVKNLFTSLLLAIFIISIIMALLFNSFRIVLIGVLVNLIPLIITSGMMGYFGIHLKPSTILVFSIAFGISVDDTIHYLGKYRMELLSSHSNIRFSVIYSLKETGVSMIYTSIILFFGFSVFDTSTFGGTQALGMLVSSTLLFAMIVNLLLLPSLLLTMNKYLTTKHFEEPLLEVYDEEVDIDFKKLNIKKEN